MEGWREGGRDKEGRKAPVFSTYVDNASEGIRAAYINFSDKCQHFPDILSVQDIGA